MVTIFDLSKSSHGDQSNVSRQQAKHNIKKYIDERVPEEYEKCQVGLNSILKGAWTTANNADDKREKIQASALFKRQDL
jgi:hypothetical protein